MLTDIHTHTPDQVLHLDHWSDRECIQKPLKLHGPVSTNSLQFRKQRMQPIPDIVPGLSNGWTTGGGSYLLTGNSFVPLLVGAISVVELTADESACQKWQDFHVLPHCLILTRHAEAICSSHKPTGGVYRRERGIRICRGRHFELNIQKVPMSFETGIQMLGCSYWNI